jgi:hypothetical protein
MGQQPRLPQRYETFSASANVSDAGMALRAGGNARIAIATPPPASSSSSSSSSSQPQQWQQPPASSAVSNPNAPDAGSHRPSPPWQQQQQQQQQQATSTPSGATPTEPHSLRFASVLSTSAAPAAPAAPSAAPAAVPATVSDAPHTASAPTSAYQPAAATAVLPNRNAADAQYAAGYAAALAALGFAGDPRTLPHPAAAASAAVASAQASQQRELLGWMSTQPAHGAASSHPYTPATNMDMPAPQGLVGLTPAPVPRKATFTDSLTVPTRSQVRVPWRCACAHCGLALIVEG